MKKIVIIAVSIVLSFKGISQETVQLKTIMDDPEYVSDKMINIVTGMTYSKNGGIGLALGADAIWGLTNKLQAQGGLFFTPIALSSQKGFDFEAGISYGLSRKTKMKDTKLVLKWSDRSYSAGGNDYRERSATTVNSKATYLKQTKVRGGVYVHKGGIEETEFPYFSTGFYGGFEFTTQAALISEIDGVRGITSGYTRFYLDGLVAPISRIDKIGTSFEYGARIGFATTFNPNKMKKATPKLVSYQAYQAMYFKAEGGYKKTEGIFFNMTFGLNLYKNR